ncbi:MAG: TAXI family TRAP transporter solute-binding subunit [Deltaproteobacteria bacterium]|nr:TAXI family TRAP transporter solute-binding subunit [Deltaproteobacteria bacterium]
MKKLKFIFSLSIILLIGGAFLWPAGPALAKAKKYILIGSTQTASSHYAYAVAATKVINKYVPEVNASVVETGASVDNVKRMRAGQLDIGGIVTIKVMYEAWKGIGMWKTIPTPDLRMLWAYTKSIDYYVVREDSGVKKLKDMDGKKINPGMRGSSTEATTKQVFEILGIKPDYHVGGTTDAVAATKDGRIAGYVKTGVGLQLDASTLDVMTLTKIRLISMTSGEVEKVKAVVPYLPFFTVPAGQIKAMPTQPEYKSWGMVVCAVAMKSFPDDLVYKAVKAIIKGRNMIIAAFPAHADVDVAQDTPELTMIPLHAGAYRAYKEMGVKIPERAIPQEAKK